MSKKFLFVNSNGDYEESAGAYEEADFISSSAGVGDAGKPIKLDSTGTLDPSFIDESDINHDDTNGAAASTVHTQFPLLDGSRDFTGTQNYNSHPTFTSDTDMVDKKYVDDVIAALETNSEWLDSALDRYDPSSSLPSSPSIGDRYLATASANGWTLDRVYEWNGTSWSETIPTTGSYISVDDETDGIYYYGGASWTKKSFASITASLGVKRVADDLQADIQLNGGLKLNSNSLLVEPADFAGAGLTDDGSDNMAIDWSTSFNDAKAIKSEDLNSTINGQGASIIGIEDADGRITATNVEGALAENRIAIDSIEDNSISSPNGSISVGGTIGADNQTIDVNFSTTFNDAKAIKADDLNSTTNGEGASIIGIEDAGSYTSTTNVEDAIQEIYGKIDNFGEAYTVGTGGVTKGDLVYISANNTVRTLTDLSQDYYCIGIAAETKSAAEQVVIMSNGLICEGCLVGASAGVRLFWSGSAWVTWTNRSTTSGDHIWAGGVGKNSSDLHVEVLFVKKNA